MSPSRTLTLIITAGRVAGFTARIVLRDGPVAILEMNQTLPSKEDCLALSRRLARTREAETVRIHDRTMPRRKAG